MKKYCGIGDPPKNHKRGSMVDCAKSGQIRYYGIKKIDKKTLEGAKLERKSVGSRKEAVLKMAKIRGKMDAVIKKAKTKNLTDAQKKTLRDQYQELKKQIEIAGAEFRKIENSRKKSRISRRKSRSRSRSRK